MRKLICLKIILLKLVIGVIREYQSLFYNQVDLIEVNST
jgi:hypothetical protein